MSKVSRNPRLILGLILFAFLLPILLAGWVYLRSDQFALSQHAHGTVISPATTLTPLTYQAADGSIQYGENLAGYWWLIYVAPDHCNATCENTLAALTQIPPALGKYTPRVKQLYLSTTFKKPDILEHQYPDMTYATIQPMDRLHYFYAHAPNATIKDNGAVFLLDPEGHLVMYFPVPLDQQGLFRDLKRLLRLSHIG